MSGARTIETEAQRATSHERGAPIVDHGFGAEFRELARQRRFVRESATPATSEPGVDWRAAAAPPRPSDAPATPPATAPVAPPAARAIAPTHAPASALATPAAAPAPTMVATPAAPTLPPLAPAAMRSARGTQRISDDQRAMLAELARMSDRLVESREALAREIARADRAEHDLQATNLRFMAARALVLEAQEATHATAERCAWLEGRCETLEAALEVAVNASWLTRLRWRRQARSAARQQ